MNEDRHQLKPRKNIFIRFAITLKQILKKLCNFIVIKSKKLKKVIKKTYRKLKYLDRVDARFYLGITVLSLFCLFVGGTYSYFNFGINLDSAFITVASLKYTLTSDNERFQDYSVTLAPKETLELTLDLKSFNEKNSKYALNYSCESNDVEVYYVDKREQNVIGEIGTRNSIINMKIAIENNSDAEQVVKFELKGGFLKNVLTSNINRVFANGLVKRILLSMTEGKDMPSDSMLHLDKSPDFNVSSPKLLSYKELWETDSNSLSPITTKYFTYSDKYSFDAETGKYSLINPQICKYSECYDNLVDKYITKEYGTTDGVLNSSNYTECIYLYKIENAEANKIYYTRGYSIEDEYDFSNDGIYSMQDDYGTSYYFRGAVENNYVKFGTWKDDGYWGINFNDSRFFNSTDKKYYNTLEECENDVSKNDDCVSYQGKPMYWRIIRVNGDGSVKLIFDGISAHRNGEKTLASLDRFVNIGSFSDGDPWYDKRSLDNKHVGYMYGSLDDTATDKRINLGDPGYEDEKNTLYNLVDSPLKSKLESWYARNLSDVDSYIADAIYCNDRSLYSGTGIGQGKTEYGAYGREDYKYKDNLQPSLKCPNKNDAFTKVESIKGNGKLKQKIGMITADEVVTAGGNYNEFEVNYNYLNKYVSYWTMTPGNYDGNFGYMFVVYRSSNLGVALIEAGQNVSLAPVISLTPEYFKTLIGDGTAENPYRERETEP